jgi:hypothetical protein
MRKWRVDLLLELVVDLEILEHLKAPDLEGLHEWCPALPW